jgi:DNA-binding NarL/FixJ family response regulator
VRAGLHALLAAERDFAVAGEVGGSLDLERVFPETRPDVVLFDAGGGDSGELNRVLGLLSARGDGLAAAPASAGIVVLGDSRTDFLRLSSAANGGLPGWAYLLREADGPGIAAAVRAVAAGLVVLDQSLAHRVGGGGSPSPASSGAATADTLPGEALTAREAEVLQLMALGLPNKIIAARLGISLHTAKFHVAQILAKLQATSRTEAVTLGARRGYVTL